MRVLGWLDVKVKVINFIRWDARRKMKGVGVLLARDGYIEKVIEVRR